MHEDLIVDTTLIYHNGKLLGIVRRATCEHVWIVTAEEWRCRICDKREKPAGIGA